MFVTIPEAATPRARRRSRGVETPTLPRTSGRVRDLTPPPLSPRVSPSVFARARRLQDGVEEVLLGAGANGIAYVDGPRVSVAFEGDIAVYFQGELRGDEMSDEFESFAHEILARYTAGQTVGACERAPPALSPSPKMHMSFQTTRVVWKSPPILRSRFDEIVDQFSRREEGGLRRRSRGDVPSLLLPRSPPPSPRILPTSHLPFLSGGGVDLGLLSGQFALVVFDKLAGCVCAARDHRGAEPLFWGTRDLGETLVFGSDAASVASRCGDADAFPAGTMFVSQCGDITGELTMLEEPEDEEEEDEEDEGYHCRDYGSAARARGSERPGFEGTTTPVRVLPTDEMDDVGGGSASDSDEGRTTATATMVAAFAGDEERRDGGMLDAEGEADEAFDDWVTTRGAGARASLMSRCERSFRDALEMDSRSESDASLRDLARGPERDPVVPSAA